MLKTTKTAEIKDCECAKYFAVTAEITDDQGQMVDEVHESTGCTATTKNDFAQGHDAKLKSALIRWGSYGYEVAWVDGGLRHGSDAMHVANRYGFSYMVAEGIAKAVAKRQAAQDRADRKHEAQAARQAPKATTKVDLTKPDREMVAAPEAPVSRETEPLPVSVQAKAKVGRWTYEGTVNVDGTFTYNAKLGGTKTVEAGSFTVLDA